MASGTGDHPDPPMMRYRLRTLLMLVAVAALLCAPIASCRYRQLRARLALRDLGEYCRSTGGGAARLLVDGETCIQLSNTRLTRADVARINALSRKVAPLNFLDSNEIYLELNRASVEGGVSSLVDERVVWLYCNHTDVDDAELRRIVARAPRLQAIFLRGTSVTDAVLPDLARLERLAYVDLHQTRMTRAAIDQSKVERRWLE